MPLPEVKGKRRLIEQFFELVVITAIVVMFAMATVVMPFMAIFVPLAMATAMLPVTTLFPVVAAVAFEPIMLFAVFLAFFLVGPALGVLALAILVMGTFMMRPVFMRPVPFFRMMAALVVLMAGSRGGTMQRQGGGEGQDEEGYQRQQLTHGSLLD